MPLPAFHASVSRGCSHIIVPSIHEFIHNRLLKQLISTALYGRVSLYIFNFSIVWVLFTDMFNTLSSKS